MMHTELHNTNVSENHANLIIQLEREILVK